MSVQAGITSRSGRKITTVIFDWAGTTVDYGSFAPLRAIVDSFAAFGVYPTIEEVRAPMGMQKRIHIEKMLEQDSLASAWLKEYGRPYSQTDIEAIYNHFEPMLFEVLPDYGELIPGVTQAVDRLRQIGLVVGSTTGYSHAMMDIVAPLAASFGYAPDSLVCPDEVGGLGRPYPYMLWRNLEKLGVEDISGVIKVGDTAADMQEAKNAGCLAVGVIKGSSMLGMSATELEATDHQELADTFEAVYQRFFQAGADYVIEEIADLPAMIESLDSSFREEL